MGKGLSDDELTAVIDAELRNSQGYWGGKLSEQRRKAEYYYLGLPKGDLSPPEIEGRSTVVSTDVRNVIEAMTPPLMMKFCSGDSVVEFEATKEGDEEKAQSCTDYINYLFWKKNSGHVIAETWIKDALLQKRGILKVWWDTRHEETREDYKGLTDVELAQILDDPEVEPIEHDQYPDEEDQKARREALSNLTQQLTQAQQAAQQGNAQALQVVIQIQAQIDNINQQPVVYLHDIAVKRVKTGGKLTIDNIPPEEFLISRKAKNIKDAPFCAHRVARTVSELRSMGYKNVDELSSDESVASFNMERVERLSYDDEYAYLNYDANNLDESQRVVWVVECYIRADRDGDGIAELLKVTKSGNTILDEEVVDCAPFVSIGAVTLPHKFFGLSVAELAMEPQRINTQLLRGGLDNIYLGLNKRQFAVEGQVNLDDLLTSRPGGVVRVKQAGAVGAIDEGLKDPSALAYMSEYMTRFREESTGWTRQSTGGGRDSISKTATEAQIIDNKDDLRIDLIARNFAEGFVELFRMMLKLVCQHQDKRAVVKLSGRWVDIDPREWRNGFDVNINVGLGSGSKNQRVQQIMALMNIQKEAMIGKLPIVNPENVYNAACDLAKEVGAKSSARYFTDPKNVPPQPPQPPLELQLKQMDIQALERSEERKHAEKMAELQANLQLQASNDVRDAERMQQKAELDAQVNSIRLQYEDKWKELENNTKVLVAEINKRAELQKTAMTINSKSEEMEAEEMDEEGEPIAKMTVADLVSAVNTNLAQLMNMQQQSHADLVQLMTRPKQVIRDETGRVQGIA